MVNGDLSRETIALLQDHWTEVVRKQFPGCGARMRYTLLDGPLVWRVELARSTNHGVEFHAIGRGGSPETAMESANRAVEREAQPKKHRAPKHPREGYPYKIAGDLFE